ncbi:MULTISPECIES: thiol reductant ABC exporter subunit CydD [unclassified Zymobacter]|uniref:thiol reductant ABC exporter subunit CydD n=1 Tax=unclassified Zymobacter TaxID=3048685 RepID=UPI0039C1866C
MSSHPLPTPAQWLRANASRGGRWNRVIMLAATGSTLLLLLQAWAIASVVYRLAIEHAPLSSLTLPLIILPVAFLGRGALAWLRTEAGVRCGLAIRQSIREDVLRRIGERGPLWSQRQHSAALGNQVWDQVDALQNYYADYRPQMLLCGMIPLIILCAVLPVSWAAALILLITGPLIPLNMAMIGWGAKNLQDQQLTETHRMSRHFLDTLKGMPTLRLLGRSHQQANEIYAVSEGVRQRNMKVLRLAFLSSSALEFFASVSIALLATYIGFTYLGQFDFGTWGKGLSLFGGLFMLILSPEFYQPLRDLGVHYHAKAEAEAAAEVLMPLLTEASQPAEASTTAAKHWAVPDTLGITLDHVSCRYPGQASPALNDVSFSVAAGETIAVIGPSGAGKSTLLTTLLGFMQPEQGTITLHSGERLDHLLTSEWQHALSWVGQHNALISGTLADNLTIALPDDQPIDEDRLWEALDKTDLRCWANQLPQGLHTRIGDGGQPVSGGQARRIGLARAFLRDAPLVLLDEPTASLDQQSERIVNRAIAALSKNRTVIMLTHRLSLLNQADRILLLEQGRVRAFDTLSALSQPHGPLANVIDTARADLDTQGEPS